jgi:hypothetical protein
MWPLPFQEGFEPFAVLLAAPRGEALAGRRRRALRAAGEEAVASGLVLEEGEDAARGGDGLGVEFCFEGDLEFVLAEEVPRPVSTPSPNSTGVAPRPDTCTWAATTRRRRHSAHACCRVAARSAGFSMALPGPFQRLAARSRIP